MDLDQYKQENEKLTARLNKAIEVFKQQKTQIDSLIQENEELKKNQNIADHDETIQNLQNKLQNSEEAYEQLRNKYVARKEEQSELSRKVEELEKQVTEDQDEINCLNQTISECKVSYDDVFKANVDLGKEIAELNAKFKENDMQKSSVELKLQGIQKEYEEKFEEQEKELIAERNEIELLHGQLIKAESDADILRKSDKEYREAFEQQKKENKETEEQYNRVLTSYENDLKELKEKYDIISKQYESKDQALKVLQQTYNKVFAEKDKLKEENILLNTQLGEAEERYDKLNLRYDNLKNEKLKLENDILVIEEKYKESLQTPKINSERETHLVDALLKIRDICDDTINHQPVSENELKQKTKKEKDIEIPNVNNLPAPRKLIKPNDSLINQAPTILL